MVVDCLSIGVLEGVATVKDTDTATVTDTVKGKDTVKAIVFQVVVNLLPVSAIVLSQQPLSKTVLWTVSVTR